ncbi:FAD-dependent oxidoreductase [Paenibacillus baimaensis]|nr:FAD-dependent oxidoreductase [Paenibacillus sp. WQ 127069]
MIRMQREQGTAVPVQVENRLFQQTYDLIVVGLGTAGAIAALTAASKGLRVLGLERLHAMGGAGTIGAVVGYYYGSKGGLFEEIDKQVQQLDSVGFTKAGGVNAELKKYVLEQRCLEAGVSVRYECAVIGAYLEGSTVQGVRWVGPSGVEEAGCRMLIDASGDAEVCAMIGAAMLLPGRLVDGKMQPYSHPIVSVQNDVVRAFYTDSGYVDQTQDNELTQAIMQSACMPTHLPEQFDESRKFLKLAPQLGIREGRFIRAEEQVTFADVLNDRLSPQPLLYAYSNMDNHNKDIAFESVQQQDWAVAASLWGITISVPIPLGALIPQGFDNVLVAGRALGVDHDLASCVRMKRDMQKCGEAAALAAYVAISEKQSLRSIDYEQLRPLLLENGCLNPSNHFGMKDSMSTQDDQNTIVSWMTDHETIKEGLASIRPGIAIWSSRREGAAINASLREWVTQQEDENLRRHSAFALALQGDAAAIPVLREIMRERDTFVPRTSRKYNQVRGYASIYLLGLLGDMEIVPELLEIIHSREQFVNLSTDVEFINHDDEYFFQYFSFSLMALFRIAERNRGVRAAIIKTIGPLVSEPDFSIMVTMKPTKDLDFDMAGTIRRIVNERFAQWQAEESAVH